MSYEEYSNELEPLEELKKLISDKWVVQANFPHPSIVIANDPEEAISRVNFGNFGEIDYIIITEGNGEQFNYRGNAIYGDFVYSVVINVLSAVSRQQVRNDYKMIKMILATYKHEFTGWQFIRPLNYRELVGTGDINIWRIEYQIQLENHGVQIPLL
jgi:hypothetical protein